MSKEKDRDNYLIRLGVLTAPPAVSIWGQGIVVERTPIQATPRRLRATWTLELEQERLWTQELEDDMRGLHGIELNGIVYDEIDEEISL